MSKVDTDQGLGPGSEPRRKELLGINADGSKSDKEAETQPGSGKPSAATTPSTTSSKDSGRADPTSRASCRRTTPPLHPNR